MGDYLEKQMLSASLKYSACVGFITFFVGAYAGYSYSDAKAEAKQAEYFKLADSICFSK